jgi:Cu-Zn family superoxide dismutase
MGRASFSARLIGGAFVSLALLGGGVAAAAAVARSSGPDAVYGPNAFDDATARVHIQHEGDGATFVTLHVKGVDAPAGQRFGAHVHQLPCGPSGADAGAHYQHAGAVGSLEQREVWLDVTVNAAGNGHSSARRPWTLDESSPRSVIIHALPTDAGTGAAGARLACIDLDGDPR